MIACPDHQHHHGICREPEHLHIQILKCGEGFPDPSRYLEVMDDPDDPPGDLGRVLCQCQHLPHLEVQGLRRQITEDDGVGIGSLQPAPGYQVVVIELCLG